MEPRRICVFCESWESGGIESFLFNILSRMDLSAMEIDIVAARLADSVFTQRLADRGVRFIELSGRQRDLAKNHRMFRELLRQRQYSVLHLNIFQGLSLCYARIARQEGVPVRIAHSHNTALRKSATRWLKMMLHRLGSALFSHDATEWWACSEAAARFMFPRRSLDGRGYRFIPNGIDVDKFRFDPKGREDTRVELGLHGAYVIGNVGRLCYQKNQDFLLDVFAEVVKRRPESRLLLVGEGEAQRTLREKAARLGVAERVLFFGVTDQVARLYWAMDAFAFPSLFEGLGIAAVEAQAAGLPVVASQFVPEEANITPLFRAVSLQAGASAWASALLSGASEGREDRAADVRAAGFDLSAVSRLVEAAYTGMEKREQVG